MVGVRTLAAVLLLTQAAAFAHAGPTGCESHVLHDVKTCRSTPNGGLGAYATTPVAFAYVGATEAGAGSLAGANAAWGGPRISVTVFAHALLAFEAVAVWVEPAESGLDGSRVGASAAHTGLPSDTASAATVTLTDDRIEDGVPDRVRIVGHAPLASADADSMERRLTLVVIGVPVVLTP